MNLNEEAAMEQELAAAFTEWARQYQADPDGFDEGAIDGDVSDYGTRCARTLLRILDELAA